MRIDNIKIRNFKGFEEKEIKLNPTFTVAIGNNGLGKSTLLHAIQVALGALLQSVPTLPANHLYRRQFKPGERFVKYHPERKDFLPNKLNPLISTFAEWIDWDGKAKELEWLREYLPSNVTTHKFSHSMQIMEYANYLFEFHGEYPDLLYPVLANFQINRTNAQVKKVDKNWKRLSKLAKGYYAALGENVDFTGVYEWLHGYDKALKDKTEFDGTREAMYESIIRAIPYIKEIEYNSRYGEFEVLVDFKDGQPIERKLASMLSDGMKSMLHMVAEITYRCIMLNGKLGYNAVKKSTGIVLIDELDMHLHPKWQMHVVSDLKGAFPNIQFVVTTHSPFIVQSLDISELINLDDPEKKTESPDDLSLSKVTTEIMGVEGIRSDDFEKRYKDAKEKLLKLSKEKKHLTTEDYLKISQLLGKVIKDETNDPIYKAYIELKDTDETN